MPQPEITVSKTGPSTMTEGQVYRAVHNLMKNELGLQDASLRDTIQKVITADVQRLVTPELIQKAVDQVVTREIAKAVGATNIQQKLREEVGEKIKKHVMQAYSVQLTVAPVDKA